MNDPQLRYVLTEIDPKKNEELKIEVPDIPEYCKFLMHLN